ncbi:MAG: class I SAM-dependent methyltransferase [Rhodospirillaceae bacterium]
MIFRRKKTPDAGAAQAPAHDAPKPGRLWRWFASRRTWVPPGHFYSPIADLHDIAARAKTIFDPDAPLPDVDLAAASQRALWDKFAAHAARFTIVFSQDEAARAGLRYYSGNDHFGPGDATIYAGMLLEHRPRRVIEVGSGFSSALFLDINAKFFGGEIAATFIEPYPARLLALLTDADRARTRLLRQTVQSVPLEVFADLEAGDILFVDSTHVAKAGSDVNHIFFRVLPVLKPGVLIHFHDIFHPFEYPREWFFDGNRSWNELYLLRAFLMNNANYRVLFFSSWFAHAHPECQDVLPNFWDNPGGGFWMRKER